MRQQHELGAFLRARRERVTPAVVGLPDHGRRRVPGLRREELALLAGVSVAYYSRLEQGHDRHPSRSVLDGLADALQLSTDERQHLHALAQSADAPTASRVVRPERVLPELVELLEHHIHAPAMVLGRALDVLMANPTARALHPSYQPGRNLALDIFLDDAAQVWYADLEQIQRNRVGALRTTAGTLPGDPRLTEVIGELSIRSAEFRKLWARHEIHATVAGTKSFLHPDVGELELRYHLFGVSANVRQQVIIYHPAPGSRHAQSLTLLSAIAAPHVTPSPDRNDKAPIPGIDP